MFDVEKSRTEFALKYGADAGIVPPARANDQDPLDFAQAYAKQMIAENDVGTGFDITGSFPSALTIPLLTVFDSRSKWRGVLRTDGDLFLEERRYL